MKTPALKPVKVITKDNKTTKYYAPEAINFIILGTYLPGNPILEISSSNDIQKKVFNITDPEDKNLTIRICKVSPAYQIIIQLPDQQKAIITREFTTRTSDKGNTYNPLTIFVSNILSQFNRGLSKDSRNNEDILKEYLTKYKGIKLTGTRQYVETFYDTHTTPFKSYIYDACYSKPDYSL